LGGLGPSEIAHRFCGGDLDIRNGVVELRYDTSHKCRVLVAAERAERVGADLYALIVGESGKDIRDRERRELRGLGISARQGACREGACVLILVPEGEQQPRSRFRSTEPAERIDGSPTDRRTRVIHEWQEIRDRRIPSQSPGLKQDLPQRRLAVLLTENNL